MNTPGPATSVATSVFGFKQNEHAAIAALAAVTTTPVVRHYLTDRQAPPYDVRFSLTSTVQGMIVFRPSARALITDPDDRVLLLRVRDAVALNAADPVTDYWITVGGGVEPGETFETAVVREIFEETGRVIDNPGPCIWRRRKSVTDAAGVTRASDERYFWCPFSSAELNHDNLNQFERTWIQEARWWTIDDPDLRRIRIFPEDFADAAGSVLRHGRPAAAQWLR